MWREAQAQQIQADAVLYNTLINTQARVGAMDAVEELLQAMALEGLEMTSVTYCMIVKGYCVVGSFDKCIQLCHDMQETHGQRRFRFHHTAGWLCTPQSSRFG